VSRNLSELRVIVCDLRKIRAGDGRTHEQDEGTGEAAQTEARQGEGGTPPADPEQTEGDGDDRDQGEAGRWLTVTDAAKAAGCNRGEISRAADKGELTSNGKNGRERRIDAVSLAQWQLKRANRPEPVESDESVRKKLERGRNN
jgi:hypothetical protein